MSSSGSIAPGTLEAYALGQLPAGEAEAVRAALEHDAALRNELAEIEGTLARLAMAHAVQPPDRARASILQAIGGKVGPNVKPLVPSPAPANNGMKWLAAASVAAFLGSAAMNVMLYQRLGNVQDRMAQLENERTVFAEQLRVQTASYRVAANELAVVTDPHRRIVTLKGMGTTPDASARIYWEPATREVHLGALTLPEPPAGKQYQLWALADGVPIDAGVFDAGAGVEGLQHMKDMAAAQAFAVTIEQRGGSASPTLGSMVLMGQVI